VYDVQRRCLSEIVKSAAVSSSFSNITCLVEKSLVLVSTSDGHLNIYAWSPNEPTSLFKSFDLEKLYASHKKLSKKADNTIDLSFLVIGMHIFSFGNEENSECMIVCATSSCLFLIDMNSDKLLNVIEFSDLPFNTKHLSMNCLIPQVAEFSVIENKQINAALLYLFNNEINVIKCADISRSNQEISSIGAGVPSDGHYLSVIPK
jgi:hypothetical protein